MTTSSKISKAAPAVSATGDHHPLVGALAPVPWARVARVQLIRQEVREFLSPSALQLLFERAEEVIEGGRDEEGRAYVTVMLSIDLACCGEMFRERPDAATAARVAELLDDDAWLRKHLRARARAGLRAQLERERARNGSHGTTEDAGDPGRRPGLGRGRVVLDVRVRSSDRRLLVDCDAMLCHTAAPSERRR